MIRSFVFSKGKLLSQDAGLDFVQMALHEDDVQVWVDLESPTPEETQQILERIFQFHPLAIEDCVAVTERPKIDDYETYFFMVVHAVDFSQLEHSFQTIELNLFIGKNFLVTYHEQPIRSISTTIDRACKNAASVARAADRLSYNILELLLENYDPALERLSDAIADLEKDILTGGGAGIPARVLDLKAQVQRLRQILAPQREVIARLARGEFKIVRAHLLPYFRDLLDRLSRLTDSTENYRDALTSVMQVHLNLQQTQANRVVRVLTVLATLSLPFVGITSYYGMNFHHMPELAWPHGPIWVAALSVALTGVIYWLLKRKQWL